MAMTMKCPRCGAPISPYHRFCTSCGSPVNTEGGFPAPAPAPAGRAASERSAPAAPPAFRKPAEPPPADGWGDPLRPKPQPRPQFQSPQARAPLGPGPGAEGPARGAGPGLGSPLANEETRAVRAPEDRLFPDEGRWPKELQNETVSIPFSMRNAWNQPVDDSSHPGSSAARARREPEVWPRPERPAPEAFQRTEQFAPADEPWPEWQTAAPSPKPARPSRAQQGKKGEERTLPALRVLLLVCVALLTAVVVLLWFKIRRDKAEIDAVVEEQETVAPVENEEPYQETRDAVLVGEEGEN